MMNQKVKNIIIILVVLLAGFSVFYFTKNKEKAIEPSINLEDATISDIGNAPALSTDKKIDSAVIENNKKFSTAMSNASSAFIKADYDLSIKYYNEALSYKKYEGAYSGLYNVYLAQKNFPKALDAINNAINANPLLGDSWKWKILVMDEGMKSSFTDLKKVYEEGYPKVKTSEKINLVTYFARLADNKGYKIDSISAWKRAIELNPDMKSVYQAEIDRLNKY